MEGRRRAAAPALALALLALLHVAAAARAILLPEHHAGRGEVTTTSSPAEFIRSRCGTTEYPHLCVSSLSAYADTIRTSPTQLADAALSVTLSHARATKALVAKLGKGAMGRRVGSAVQDCVETMGDSVDELRDSLRAMARLGGGGGGSGKGGHGKIVDLGLQVDDIRTWVSAALTDEDTCMDEFAGKAMDGEVKAALRGHVSKVARLTSNALALVSGLASSVHSP